MKIYSLGLDQLTVNEIKNAGFTVVTQSVWPEPPHTEGHMLIVTSEQLPFTELREMRGKYPETTIVYVYLQQGVHSYHTVHMTCESLGVYFIPPRFTSSVVLEKIRLILGEEGEAPGNIVSFCGSGPGIGCTSLAKLFARRIAAAGQRVILLGLDVYDPGYDRKTLISLDRLRPRLTGKMLHDDDFSHFIEQDGYLYLPGSYDFLCAQDYQEEEIEYLLEQAGRRADVVIADLGSIPESAAWYVGMQKAALRMMVTHPKHEYRLESFMELAGQLDLHPQDIQFIINRNNMEEFISPKNLALRFGTEILLELPYYQPFQETPPLGKKELQQVDGKVQALLVSLGLVPEVRKRGIFA